MDVVALLKDSFLFFDGVFFVSFIWTFLKILEREKKKAGILLKPYWN